MDTLEEPIHVVIRLPYARPEGYIDTQPVQWTEAMEKTLWQIIGHTKPSLVDWNAVSRQLGNVPVPFLIRHAAFLYQNQIQDLHRIGEQQDLTAQLLTASRPTSRGVIGPGTVTTSFEEHHATQQSLPFPPGAPPAKDSSPAELTGAVLWEGEKDARMAVKKESAASFGANIINPNSNINHAQESTSKAQASPSLSGSISTFASSARPASMSSSASTIRPVQPSSPSPSMRGAATADTNVYNSGGLSNRGTCQPRSTRGSQLIGGALPERRLNNPVAALSTSPKDELSLAEASRRILEPAHPFHQATISASARLINPSGPSAKDSPGRSVDQGHPAAFQDHERSSTVSTVSTPYSQSNSTSQIFEETSFFNQVSSNESMSRGQQRRPDDLNHEDLVGRGAFQQSPFAQSQGFYGLGFVDQTPYYSQDSRHAVEDEEDEDEHTDKDAESENENHDESGPLSERIKQLHLEDVLAFLPAGGASASGVLPRSAENDEQQRRTTLGEKMPFQLDDELASLGTRTLEEILQHDAGDEDDDHRVRGIRFKETVGPHRMRGPVRDGEPSSKIRTSPERSGLNSRKSSAQNSVGSSFSDLSDSSVTQSAMEDAYLSGYNNNSSKM